MSCPMRRTEHSRALALTPYPHIHVQETGRGGRDGAEAWCLLYYNYSDAQKARHMLTSSAQENGTPPEVLRCNMDSLNAMVRARVGVWGIKGAGNDCGVLEDWLNTLVRACVGGARYKG